MAQTPAPQKWSPVMTLNVENLDRLISHLDGLPEEKFNMKHLFLVNGDVVFGAVNQHECGTAACIAGNAYWISGSADPCWGGREAADWLGLTYEKGDELFMPAGWSTAPSRYPLPRAIRTLKHMRSEFLRTGEVVVDWDAPEPVEKPAWAAPKAVERVLPEEIVSLLRLAHRSEVSA